MNLVAWTTTPWTIPGNEAVAINPRINYVFASDQNGNIYLFARDLISDTVQKTTNWTQATAEQTNNSGDLKNANTQIKGVKMVY